MLIELIETYAVQIAPVESLMTETLGRTPEASYLLSIPGVAPVTAAVFLGSIGDPAAYDTSKQLLRVAGLTRTSSRSGAFGRTASSGRSTRACAPATAAARSRR